MKYIQQLIKKLKK